MKQKRKYKIQGAVYNERDGHGATNLRVEAWDKTLVIDAPLGTAQTAKNGKFSLNYDKVYYKEICEERKPDIYFKIFHEEELIHSTEDSVLWNVVNGEERIKISVSLESLQEQYTVKGKVTDEANNPLSKLQVQAVRRYLRREISVGSSQTNEQGDYHIDYVVSAADVNVLKLAFKIIDQEGTLLHQTEIHHDISKETVIDIQLPTVFPGFSEFERLARALHPLLEEGLSFADLEQDDVHDDINFLSGETDIEKTRLVRFIMAHKLGMLGIQAEFWYALLGGSFFQYTETQSLNDQLTAILDTLSSLDAVAVRKALIRNFNLREIPETFKDTVSDWIEAFLNFVASQTVGTAGKPTFVKLALEDAGIKEIGKREKFARLFNEYKALTPELLETLEQDESFEYAEIANLHTTFKLAELTQSDFTVVKMIKEEFGVRKPEQIRPLAKKSEDEWINLVEEKYATGEITLPFEMSALPGNLKFPYTEVYAKTLVRQFREAFPTTAFAGGLARALSNGAVKGLRHAETLGSFLDDQPDFELLNTPVDDFFKSSSLSDSELSGLDEEFQLELKAVQRVFKLTPTFETTDILLADRLHSAQQIYRLGETVFVRRYEKQPGFTTESARQAWNKAADTHAAVLTIIADLKSLTGFALPSVLRRDSEALSTFPNWDNLFKSGDVCECEHCRSVLSPAAYFADLLMFLKDRNAANPAYNVNDVLFERRPDLGYLELNCANALTPLPYIDVVCEVLEDVVAAGENDLELTGLTAIPADVVAANTAVESAFADQDIVLGEDFSLSQVNPADPDLWVVHGDAVTYLLKKNSTLNYFAQILPNTKASADELRAYPQYVNPKAYEKLREAVYPSTLPFDLFAEDVRAAFQKTNLKRWDLMRTFRGTTSSNNSTVGEIAAEYFGISTDPFAAFDEKRLILEADTTIAGQQSVWGETGNTGWLDTIGNVKIFLQKTGLEYNDLLALLDLKLINLTGDIAIYHDDPSCDTNKKSIQVLDAQKLDRIHRFLRLWRKLNDWKFWELDLVIRHPAIGNGSLDEAFLINLFYFDQLKKRLGKKATVEHVCALFGNLNTETRFTKLHEKREDALYHDLFLNRRHIQPLDPAFQIAPDTGDLTTGEYITDTDHLPVVLAAVGIREADLALLIELTKASDGTEYITDDLNLANLSFLWRHTWLAKILKFKLEEWKILLKIFQQDIVQFTNPQAAWEFIEALDQLKTTGFKPDELNWLLAADRTAKAATRESDAARFLTGLRKELQVIKAEYDPSQYDFLSATPPSDTENLITILTSLLQKLNRDEAETQFFIATLRDEVAIETIVTGLPAGFDFPDAIKSAIRIRYDEPNTTLHFTGLMTDAEPTILLTDTSLGSVTGIVAYQDAIEDLFIRPRLTLKFYELVFTAPLADLPVVIDFNNLPDNVLARKVSYDAEQRLLRFVGIMSDEEKAALYDLSADADYRDALDSLADQPKSADPSGEGIWLLDTDLQFPLRDLVVPTSDNLGQNLKTATTKALSYLHVISSENAIVQHSSAQLGLTESLTRILLTRYPVLPETLMTHLTETFANTTGVVDYATQQATFNCWYWAKRVAVIWVKWKITLEELKKLSFLSTVGHLVDFSSLPLDNASPFASVDHFIRTSRLLYMRDTLPETKISLLEVLEKLNNGVYASPADFANDVQLLNENWMSNEIAALINSLDFDYPTDYLLVESWERIRRAFYFLDNLNSGVDVVIKFAQAAMDDEQAKTIKELLRSKFGTETWLTLCAEIQDVLRERKRDALAAYLLTQPVPANPPSGKWENTNDLYAYYLLDIEMSSCQLTSRLVQGSGSIQLFVQRCFMGLELEVEVKADGSDGDSAWRWWKWMRKYRVWEANRKVFLFPENWIEPELKKDRSPFFKDLENELLQNEINQYNVEKAFTNYLEKLDGVAQLEIAGFYQEDDGDNSILHVFGRTRGTMPHLYYYRRYDYRQWSPWEKVELDIHGNYLIPAVINKRLFLFWPIFTEVPDEKANSTVSIPQAGQTDFDVQKAMKRLRLQMALSEYRQGQWTPKRVSKEFDDSEEYDVEIVKKHYHFFPIDRSEVDGRFAIMYGGYSLDSEENPCAYFDWANTGDYAVAYPITSPAFEILGCEGVPQLTNFPSNYQYAFRPESDATGYDTTYLKWVELCDRSEAAENDFTLENCFSNKVFSQLLRQTPWIFVMTPPWQVSYFDKLLLDGSLWPAAYQLQYLAQLFHDGILLPELDRFPFTPVGSWLPFYYHDKKRTFFVLPSNIFWGERYYYPELKRAYREAEGFFEGAIESYVENIDLSALTAVDRGLLEVFLHQQFAFDTPPLRETAPSYTDEQVQTLLRRFYMRAVHLFLGITSLSLFEDRQFHFKNYYHPFACDFAKLVYDPLKGIPALMRRETQLQDTGFIFDQYYQPTDKVAKLPPEFLLLEDCYPREVVDFTPNGAYSPYNWEIFFHVPLMIANQLSKNQRFQEARDWYHYIFNPIGLESVMPGGPDMSKYWITKPFYETTDEEYIKHHIDNILRMLAGDVNVPGYSAQAKEDLEAQVFDWRTNPFEPHRIANYRQVAYQKTVVMKYLDNLIAWGDYLSRQDSMESINEATQLYVLAAEILGARPKKIPPQAKPPVESFNELEEEFGKFTNALVQVENLIPPLPGNGLDGVDPAPLPMLYFCIPQNDQFLGYWDMVADRLYKIRHCMNIEGVVRQLALFEPPIDPGALVKAVAGGVDISSALADLNVPLPRYRFSILLQKANEVCTDVKSLGGTLLAALEKRDAEELSLLRQGQEVRLLDAVKSLREQQLEEAKVNLESMLKNREVITIRRDYYQDIKEVIASEKLHQEKLEQALIAQEISGAINVAASIAHFFPNVDIGNVGPLPNYTVMFGGSNIGSALNAIAGAFTVWGNVENYKANKAATNAGRERRWDDWKFQESLANAELKQIDRAIASADLRVTIAEKELDNHVLQIENAKMTDEFMRSKYTNEDLYQWQVGQISGVYFQSYKLAYDLAKQAERCLRFELGLQNSSYIQFGYWDSLKKGLLSGEKLQYDLRRLELAYLEQNRREFELTKHISLALLDPLALVKLRETGRCFFSLPEELFDLDYPGHYFRRIKSVSLTLPCVVGPYTTVSCTIRLLKNSVRINTANGDNGYPHNTNDQGLPSSDDRFIENNIPVKAIAASNAQNDSGVFELSFRDERYLPFEGAGAISEWSLELFSDLPSNNPDPMDPDFGRPLRQFDYSTISDAILHIKYTAREDAGAFKNGAVTHLRDYFEQEGSTHSLRMFNLRQEFPNQWHSFLHPTNTADGNVFELEMVPSLFPMRDQGKTLKINMIWLLANGTDAESYGVVITPPPEEPDTFTLTPVNQYGGLYFSQKDTSALAVEVVPTDPPVTWQLIMTRSDSGNLDVEDVLLVLGYEWE
jgi:hypothetical protein